ncbi:MAG TPA: hypothetical protein VK590_16145, partial [Saprospiraceae bacterium]|nr:hypothetical protein [Saprospiraceae bacterium]
MKKYIENSLTVYEYSFKDWWFGRWTGDFIQPGKHQRKESESGETIIEFLPISEWEKIKEKRKEIYWDKVNEKLESLIFSFYNQFKSSTERESFLSSEINKYRSVLSKEIEPFVQLNLAIFPPVNYNNHNISSYRWIRENYEKQIEKNQRDYSITSSPNCQFSIGNGEIYLILTDVAYKYYKWLSYLQNGTIDTNVILGKYYNSGNTMKDLQKIYFNSMQYPLELKNDSIPKSILNYFNLKNKFLFLSTNSIKNFPITPKIYRYLIQRDKTLKSNLEPIFKRYALGFLKGFKTEFIPAIDTPEAKRELILNALDIEIPKDFTITIKSDNYNEGSFYQLGIIAGRNYKAWTIILQTPNLFKSEYLFINIESTIIKPTIKLINSYQWLGNIEKDIPLLFDLMLNKYNLIDPITEYEDFKEIFTGKPINNLKPLKWHNDIVSEVIYFDLVLGSKVKKVWNIYQRM